MARTEEMVVIDTKIPEPDSQFRLRPCSCSSENVGYLQIHAGSIKPWAVRCFTCGKTSDMFLVRHDAQIYWNTNMAVTPKKELRMNHANLLKDALQGSGFVRRGSAFFRVWGDGVLQVLKFEHQPGDRVHDLSIGIFLMYGNLYPQWFTSGGCIPRGSITDFVGLQLVDGHLSPNRFTKNGDGQFLYDGFPVSVDSTQRLWDKNGERWRYYFTPEQQIHIFVEKVLPWLNDMTSQSLAAKAMYKIWPAPNDSLRFDAHLAAGEWIQAEQTMSAILKQHADARASWERTFSQDKFLKMATRLEMEDIPLKAAHKMVQEKDEEAICNYLRDNYKRNCELAKFCMK